MTFSGLVFLFRFLPLFLFVYFVVPKRMRNLILFFGSLLFYGWGEPLFLTVMLFSTVSDYIHGILIYRFLEKKQTKKAKIVLISSVCINLICLGMFKYTGWFPLPIGISFYTFQTMSYTIDIYRKEADVQRSILNFGVFVTMFPQLVAGPIVKYKTIESELRTRTTNIEKIYYGAGRLIIGLGKKVLLANNIGMLWEYVYHLNTDERTVLLAWMGAAAYAFQIYFDFSGYSDMAIGLGAILGFSFPENFNYPYVAESITDFWRRWHISLSSWFREYVYIPLGGNRKGLKRQLLNILLVWMLTGIWHGAGWNFLVWGLWFALFLIIEKIGFLAVLKRLPRFLSFLYTITIVLISWVFFASESLKDSLLYIKNMFLFWYSPFFDGNTWYQISNYYLLFLLCAICAIPSGKKLTDMMRKKKESVFLFVETIAMVWIFVLSVAYIVDASYNPFLYFRF